MSDNNRHNRTLLTAIAAAAVMLLTGGCSGLTKEAKEMVGDYYINEVSADLPVMELKSDGTIVQRAIKPGVLTYSVKGKWNVKRDSLIVENEPIPFDVEGDSTLIGTIPPRMAKAVVGFNGLTLTLRHDGADYVYFRRGHRENNDD